jgi:mono/diheme cytochrome c family protein
MKSKSGREFGVRVVMSLALATSCVPGVKETPPGPDINNLPPQSRPPSGPPPNYGDPTTSERPAKPIIGGTLLVLDDGRTAIAADPDRNRVYVADYRSQKVVADFDLQPDDEPGRLVADGDGQVHVALRGGGAVLTLTPGPWRITGRRPVCTAPRGLAYDADQRQIHVACADGELVSLPIAPDAEPVRRLMLERDLRDVVVDGDSLLISKFRSAEVLTIDRAGAIVGRKTPGSRRTIRPIATDSNGNPVGEGSADVARGPGFNDGGNATMTAAVAWKMIPVRNGEALLLHQRGLADEVSETQGGYSGQGCGGIVETTVSRVGLLGDDSPRPSLPAGPVAVDLALSRDGERLAVVSPGLAKANPNGGFRFGAQQVVELPYGFVQQTAQVCDQPGGVGGSTGSRPVPTTGGTGGSDGSGGTGGSPGDGGVGDGGTPDDEIPPPTIDFQQPSGEAVAVAYDPRGHLLVQTREPATIQVLTARRMVVLSYDHRNDTGHAIFHTDSGGGIACASCHPEGGDDGRVWKFRNKKGVLEVRRTQNLRGGVMGTAPFHWNGDLKGLGDLMEEVFVERMQGPNLGPEYVGTLSKWIDTIPALPKLPVSNADAVSRGQALYAATGCMTCHNGALLTNNTTADVGTGRALQVPSLRGVAWRAPYMHDGCAATLTQRFNGKCGGADKHGVTSKLTPAQIADLVAFVETL